jgi:glycosyltransferase involved in cell wall biosynthesis
MDNIKVTVYCITYNHVDLIAKALDGFIMQKTNFKYEVLIHDDCSTDGTTEILKRYETKYPELLRIVYEKENQYSKGTRISSIMQPLIRGDYVARCEGDDYWTDPDKLQKQFDFMEAHKEVALSVHSAIEHNLITGKKYKIPSEQKESKAVPIEDIIAYGGGHFPTCSFMYNRKMFQLDYDKWGDGICGDHRIILQAALSGKQVYYIDDCMAVHTYLYKGSWSQRHESNLELMKEFRKKAINSMINFNEDTNYKYNEAVQKYIKKIKFLLEVVLEDNPKLLFDDYYKEIYKAMPLFTKVIWHFKAYTPTAYKVCQRIKRKIISNGKKYKK